MMPHLVFIISYFYYIYFYLNHCNKIIYPVFLFPFIVYLFILIFVFLDNKIKKESLILIFQRYSDFLYLFLLFAFSSLFLRLNLPEPHNFDQRKLEIMLGAVYSVFLVVCCIKFIIKFYANYIFIENKKIFWFIFFFFFFFYFSVTLWFNYANQPTGDEPEYILMAHSVVYDGDLDLKNNFANRDYTIFYKDKNLYPQDASIKKGEKLYSYHPFFISIIISPFYFMGKRLGITIFLNFISALMVGLFFLLIQNIYMDKKTSFFTALTTGFSMPLINHINHIATDIMSGFILTFAFYIMLSFPHRYLLFSLFIMVGVWLHPRNIPFAFIMILLFTYKNMKILKNTIITLLLQTFNFVMFFSINRIFYGKLIPSQGVEKTGENFLGGFHFDYIKSAVAFAGLFFDQEFGLFFYTPVFIVFLSGYYFLYRQKKGMFYHLIFILIPFLFFISMWGEWRGGGGSSPRFFIPVFFTLVIPLAAVIYNLKNKLTKIIFYILAFSGFLMSFFILLIPWLRWNKGYGENWILKILSSFMNINLTNFFPSLWSINKYSIFTLILWIGITIILNILFILNNKNTLTNK